MLAKLGEVGKLIIQSLVCSKCLFLCLYYECYQHFHFNANLHFWIVSVIRQTHITKHLSPTFILWLSNCHCRAMKKTMPHCCCINKNSSVSGHKSQSPIMKQIRILSPKETFDLIYGHILKIEFRWNWTKSLRVMLFFKTLSPMINK